jgi:methylated-DNA-protein-cysteine methyltransferase related protein
MSALDDLWAVVRSIPSGCVASYGDVGRALPRPVSGVLVGKWMASCPPDVPWWRVVGRQGDLLTARRDSHLAKRQKEVLVKEGVAFDDDRVASSFFWVP